MKKKRSYSIFFICLLFILLVDTFKVMPVAKELSEEVEAEIAFGKNGPEDDIVIFEGDEISKGFEMGDDWVISSNYQSDTDGNFEWQLENHTLTIAGNGDVDHTLWWQTSDKMSNADGVYYVLIENGITGFGESLFYKSELRSISIPASVTHINKSAFAWSYLMEVTLPQGLTEIAEWTFDACHYLKRIVLPDNITTIGAHSIRECYQLEEIVIPSKVTYIGKMAFAYDRKLSKIVFTGDKPEIGEMAFCSVSATAYYPANNNTWDTYLGSYDGTIRWVPYTSMDEIAISTEPIIIPDPLAVKYGFSDSVIHPKDVVKVEDQNIRNDDGSNTFLTEFTTTAGNEFFSGITFEVIDVTPEAYAQLFRDMEIPYEEPVLSVSVMKKSDLYFSVLTPYIGTVEPSSEKRATAGLRVTIQAGMSVRAVKLIALKDGQILDVEYLTSGFYNQSGEAPECDIQFAREVRRRVEAVLWKDCTSRTEKFSRLANYINTTTHYPGEQTCEKALNPTLWQRFSVDGQFLFYDESIDLYLNSAMKLQGGITTCVAAQLLKKAAVEDLGLMDVYDSANGIIADGEGCYIGVGKMSTGDSYAHETFWYIDKRDVKHAYDVQGMFWRSCEAHNCLTKIVNI